MRFGDQDICAESEGWQVKEEEGANSAFKVELDRIAQVIESKISQFMDQLESREGKEGPLTESVSPSLEFSGDL